MLVGHYSVKYYIYKIVLSAYALIDIGRIHPARERALRALNNTVDYIEAKMPDALGFGAHREVLEYSLSEVNVQGDYLELGVFMGGSIRFMAKRKPHVQFHGFDSFEGLPEAWHGFNLDKNALTLQGKLPKVPGNVTLYKGWFKDTLAQWIAKRGGPIAFIHMDCDIYSSTKEALEILKPYLKVGTIILFDEYFNYPNWEKHEFLAWQEFVAQNGVEYHYMAYARTQAAVRITKI